MGRFRVLRQKALVICVVLTSALSAITHAENTTTSKVDIPVVDDAKVFAQFDDEMPAVINYFSRLSEEDIIRFYSDKIGQAESQERKRGRLTLIFSNVEQQTRVVISQQNNQRQVDILVDKK